MSSELLDPRPRVAFPVSRQGMRGQPAQVGAGSGGQAVPTLILIGLGVLVLPYGLITAAAGIARLLFPVYALLLAGYVYRRWRPCYLSFCIALLLFCPYLRRVADFHAGFEQTNPILLAPYVALLPCLLSLVRLMARPGAPMRLGFIVMTALFCYASLLAVAGGKLIQAFYEPLGWVLPVAACAFVIEHREQRDAIRRSLRWALILMLPIITLYGIEQFLAPSDIDRMWMMNVDNASFGKPVAYEVRVFSTMNGPGVAGVFTEAAMLFLLGEGLLGGLVSIATLPLLALTLVRAAWFGCGMGLLVAVVLMPSLRRVQLLMLSAAAVLGILLFMSSPAVPPDLQNYLLDRWQSLFELRNDSSANDRLDTYAASVDRMADTPWGEGYGANASAIQKRDTVSIDSGFLEALIIYGIVGGIVYLLALFAFVFAGFRACLAHRNQLVLCFATFASLVVCLPFGSHQTAESSFIGWIALGLLLAASGPDIASPREPAAAMPGDPDMIAPGDRDASAGRTAPIRRAPR